MSGTFWLCHSTYRRGDLTRPPISFAPFAAFALFLLSGGCTQIRVPDPVVRIVAFGDSSTRGSSGRDYPDILGELLDEPSEHLANQGEDGEDSSGGLVRLQGLLADGAYPSAEVLLYWEGGNDVVGFIKEHDPFLLFLPDDPDYPFADELKRRLDETQANIESAIMAARRAGLAVYVATYFLLREDIGECGALPLDLVLPAQARGANAYILMLNERIRAAAANQATFLVDVGAEGDMIGADAGNYVDCNHLSEQGNSIVARLFHDAMTESSD